MTAGSAQARKAARDAFGYTTGHNARRCDQCRHCQAAPDWMSKTRYDRLCDLHQTPVKTHGHCKAWGGA